MDGMTNLIRLMNLPRSIVSVSRTVDGHYIGMDAGDVGYNHFFGKPAPIHSGPGLEATLALWATLTEAERLDVRLAARNAEGSPIPLSEFGLPD